MTWRVTAEPSLFDEAVDWFANRTIVTKKTANRLGDYSAGRAFTIAGVAQLDVINEVHASIGRAIESGIPFEEWQRATEDTLTRAWGQRDSFRVETIFRNATSQAHNAGRWDQMQDPDVKRFRPYGMFDGVVDSRTSAICRPLDGTILPLDDPWWETHSPQLHHRCRSSIRSLRATDAERRGISKTAPEIDADTGFGKIPTAEQWAPDKSKYPPSLFAEYTTKRKQIERDTKRKRATVSK